jgi:hypothetical protein
MKSFRLICAASAFTLLLATGANACDFIYDEVAKITRGECALTIDRKAPLVRREMALARTRLPIPDLLIDKLKFRLRGNRLEVYADIHNQGTGSSAATTVVLNVTLMDPLAPGNATTQPLGPAVVPVLASMATQRVLIGAVTVDYSVTDVDVVSAGMVDPVTNAQPVRGSLFELDESNNAVMHLCRVYGPPANAAVQPCN